jgi:DNA-binding CsgD family transcriptional regulator/tetratricopeptide (TPR) repeat protein
VGVTLEPLLEREAEIARIDGVIARAVDGHGGVTIIQGPAGIGKTQLLAGAAAAARGASAAVRSARAGEMEQSFAFGIVRQLFEPLLAAASPADRERYHEGAAGLAAPLFDPARLGERGEDDDAMYPRLHGLFWLCVNIAQERGLVLCVDDAQWCDEPSLLFLEFLARRIADVPVGLVVATRPVGAATPRSLVGLTTDATSDVLSPAGLSHEAVSTLLARRLGQESEKPFTDACLATTGGNPFLVGELSRLLADEAIPPRGAMAARVTELGPKAIADNVLLRVSRLPAGARELVTTIAVLGDGAAAADAATLGAVDARQADALARELRDAGVLADGPALAFAHPVLRTAVYESIPAVDRERAHVAAATLLAGRASPPEQVAAHLLCVQRRLGDWVVPILRDAATHALSVGDVAVAERYLQRGLLEEPDPATHAALLSALGHAQARSMDPAAVTTLHAAIAAAPDPAAGAQAALELGVVLLFSGRIDEYVAVVTSAQARLRDEDSALADHLEAGLLGATLISVTAAQRLRPRIEALQDPGGPAAGLRDRIGLITLAYHGSMDGRPATEVTDQLRRALADDGLLRGVHDTLTSPMMASSTLAVCEQYGELEAMCSELLATYRERGSAFLSVAALTLRSWVALRRGNLLAAETDAREALDLIDAVGFVGFHTSIAQATLIGCALETGADLGPLRVVLDAPAPPLELSPHSLITHARALGLADRGDLEAALASLLACDQPGWVGGNPALIGWRSSAALILAKLGRHDEARPLADEELRRARAFGTPRATGVALRARGLLADGAEAEALLTEAVDVLAASEARLEHARALVDLGALRRRGRERVQSRTLLREGHDLAVLCGATRLAEAARRELAASGLRLAAPGLSGAQALTPSERRVAAMAAQGMRNREIAQSLFVTEKTVETHLSRSYDKLNIRSRSKLAGALGA